MAYSPSSGGFSYRRRGPAGKSSRLDLAIRTEGIAQLRRGLRKTEPEVDARIKDELVKIALPALVRAQRAAPRDKGTLAGSIKVSVQQREAALYTSLDYAKAHEWGTSGRSDSRVQPRGVPILIERSQMVGRAVYSYRPLIERRLLSLFERTVKRNGFDD